MITSSHIEGIQDHSPRSSKPTFRETTCVKEKVIQEGGGGWNPSPEFLKCCSILKPFYLKWKAFDLLNKIRYISWVVALLEACDVTTMVAILDFTKN